MDPRQSPERALVELDEPVPEVVACPEAGVPGVVARLLHLLGDPARGDPAANRLKLRALLTELAPGSLPSGALPSLDALWAAEARSRPVVDAARLPRLAARGWASRVSLWRGDLTTLAATAIVNAANSGLTGCYRPFHACVDNAIHTAAGPRLREDCARIMAHRGRPEPTATATAPRAWVPPPRYVLHTVGPIVEGPAPTAEDSGLLARCYEACLEAAAGLVAIRSVAFCGISTGLFGYPTSAAAPLALATVRRWLERSEAIEQVVLVTYTDSDEAVYARAASEALREA